MKVVFLLFDSLTRKALSCYGGQLETPNFQRLADRSVLFDKHYVGSLPCMPARRDFQTGRLGFMHRSWGPLEPFDDSLPELLSQKGVYSHLATDHYHYFEDGGATYHNRYTTYDFIRGQEGDAWVPEVAPDFAALERTYHPLQIEKTRSGHRLQGLLNRQRIDQEQSFPMRQTFDAGLRFLEANGKHDDWLLQLETFDPHEPFLAPESYRSLHDTGYQGPVLDWPRYKKVDNLPEEVEELRANYAALVRFCDAQLGRLLDDFDANNRWSDTAIVLTTDHGFLLGEHGWWGKNQMPFYEEIAHIPLVIYHPDHQDKAGTRVSALTQTIDVMPTLLDMHSVPVPDDVTGRSMMGLISGAQESIRQSALYGIYAGAANITDGRYTYFRYPAEMESTGLFEYTLMPTHNYSRFEVKELSDATLHPPMQFTKGVPVLKVPALTDAKRSPRQGGFYDCTTQLYDLQADPDQSSSLPDPAVEERLCDLIAEQMVLHDAPDELFTRWNIPKQRS